MTKLAVRINPIITRGDEEEFDDSQEQYLEIDAELLAQVLEGIEAFQDIVWGWDRKHDN